MASDPSIIKDLRVATQRSVSNGDSIIISGAEYLRKSRLARAAERFGLDGPERIAAARKPSRQEARVAELEADLETARQVNNDLKDKLESLRAEHASTGRGDLAAALRRYHEQIAPWVAAGCPADPLPSISSEECVAAEAALFRSAGVLSPGQRERDGQRFGTVIPPVTHQQHHLALVEIRELKAEVEALRGAGQPSLDREERVYRVVAVNLKNEFLGSVAGGWTVEVEGWQKEPPKVGERLYPESALSAPRETREGDAN
jgi:hypothetical protein